MESQEMILLWKYRRKKSLKEQIKITGAENTSTDKPPGHLKTHAKKLKEINMINSR